MHFVDKAFDVKRLWESVDEYISAAYSDETLNKVYLHRAGGKWTERMAIYLYSVKGNTDKLIACFSCAAIYSIIIYS